MNNRIALIMNDRILLSMNVVSLFFVFFLSIYTLPKTMEYYAKKYKFHINLREKWGYGGLSMILLGYMWIKEGGLFTKQISISSVGIPILIDLIVETIVFVMIILSFVDLHCKKLPNELIFVLFFAGVILHIIDNCVIQIPEGILSRNAISWKPFLGFVLSERVLGFFALSIPFMVLDFFQPGNIGAGDMKLLAAAGFLMGTLLVLEATLIGSAVAAVICIIQLARKKIRKRDKIAFGP